MSSKHPTHSAYIVVRQDGSDKKAQWFEIGTVWSHNDGDGFDVVIPAGVAPEPSAQALQEAIRNAAPALRRVGGRRAVLRPGRRRGRRPGTRLTRRTGSGRARRP